MVANIDKLIGDPVVACVRGSRSGLLKAVDIKNRLKPTKVIIDIKTPYNDTDHDESPEGEEQ